MSQDELGGALPIFSCRLGKKRESNFLVKSPIFRQNLLAPLIEPQVLKGSLMTLLRQFRFLIHPSTNWFSAYVVAPLLFCAWVAWLRVQNRLFAWLGRISYSIYLFHHAVMIPLFSWVAWESNAALRGWPLPVYLIGTLLVTVAVSAVVFYAVELPAIAIGKRLAGRRAGDIGVQAAP